MKRSAVLALVAALAVAAVCVRLGFWQLSRLEQKRALNRALAAALAAPIVDLDVASPAPSLLHRRVRASGVYDSSRHVLLRGRAHDGVPGVEVVTPLRLEGGAAMLVRRGWLPAPDAASARPQDYPEPGRVTVVGVAEPGAPASGAGAVRSTEEAGGVTLLSTREPVLDSLRRYLPYPLLGFVMRQLPDSTLAARPVRVPPRPADESMHLSYAVQWFSFATIIVVGSAALGLRRRRSGPPPGWRLGDGR
jgi:surfeit locus 1 family protein